MNLFLEQRRRSLGGLCECNPQHPPIPHYSYSFKFPELVTAKSLVNSCVKGILSPFDTMDNDLLETFCVPGLHLHALSLLILQ